MEKNIYFIGFMASGKSTLGLKISKSLDCPFVDLDQVIEEKEGLNINQIFNQKGAEYFRKVEADMLKEKTKEINKASVFSVGGGTPFFFNNFELMQENGVVLYLELPLKIIIGRLKKDKQNRPLVKDLNENELVSKISAMFNERKAIYEKADLILDAQRSKSQLKNEIIAFVESQK